jgi:ATP-dependent DNA helicase PIF1
MALSNEQTYSLEQFKNGKNLFITGPGGTGKTKLIHHLVDYAKSNSKYYQVCAMTGCAAILLNCGARTIHSWSGIKMGKGPTDKIIASILRNKNLVSNWRKVQILIVDEVSMMSEKIFNLLNEIGKKTRKSILPFGGIQLIFTGDFYQLPPVPTAGEPETERFCFESNLWFSIFPIENHIQLTTMFRQTDPLYIDILLQIRNGELTEENKKILQKYVKREYNAAEHNDCVLTKLFPVRNKADFVNNAQFSKIQEKEYSFQCHIKTDCSTYIENNKAISLDLLSKSRTLSQNEIQYEIDSLINNTPCSQILALKKGAAVMCTVNIDMESGICNGSQGVVINIVENPKVSGDFTPVVKFSNGLVRTIQKHYWQSDEYPTIAVGQYPLVLAWALTIHKIQGATMSMAEIDIGFSIFEYGQTYVALSRIQSLDGLYLSAFNPDRIRTNPKVIEFYKNIPKVENLECSQKGPGSLDFAKGSLDFAKGSLDFDKYVYKEPEVPKDVKVIRL